MSNEREFFCRDKKKSIPKSNIIGTCNNGIGISLNNKLCSNEGFEDSTTQTNDCITYKNLLDSKLQNNFRQYRKEIEKEYEKRHSNRGVIITKDFMKWIKQKKDITNDKKGYLLNKCTEINKNQEITKYIIDKVMNTKLSKNKIADSIRNFGLNLSWDTVNKVAKNEVFKGDKERHDRRFLRIPYEIENKIIKILEEEAKKESPTPLNEIWRDLNKVVPISTIQNIAKRNLGEDLYKKLWKSNTDLISEDLRSKIEDRLLREFEKENPRSLRSIADDFPNVSKNIPTNIAKEIFTDEEFDAKWGQIIPVEVKQEIIDLLKKEYKEEYPITISIMSDLFPVSNSTILRLGRKLFGEDKFTNKWHNDDVIRSGYLGHQCINKTLTKFFQDKNIKYYCELEIFHDYRRVDGLLINIEYLYRRLFNLNNAYYLNTILNIDLNIYSKIKAIVFEFTSDITFANVIKKVSKYQHPQIMLFIINTGKYWKDPTNIIINDIDVIYPDNFRIINYNFFLKLIGLDEEYKKRFLKIIEHISKRDIENLKKCSSSNLTLNHGKELRKTFKKVFEGYKTLEEIESRYISDIIDYIY
jgi:DNA-binding Lrp family transcriptional regulator